MLLLLQAAAAAHHDSESVARRLQSPAAHILWRVLADQVAHLLLCLELLQAATVLLLPASVKCKQKTNSSGRGANTVAGEWQDVWCVASSMQLPALPAAVSREPAAHATAP
jgi:hypothetical protein